MERNAPTSLQRLRSRPLYERRILGLSAYAAASAVVIALWLASLEKTMQIAPPAGEAMPTPMAASNETGIEQSPLAALKEAAGTAIIGIKEFSSRIRRLNKELAQSTGSLPTAPGELLSRERTEVLPHQSEKEAPPLEEEVPKAKPVSAAETLTGGLKAKTYSTYATGRLASPPAGIRAEVIPEPKPASRIMAVINYNLAEMRQAASDFYHYLKGN